MVGGLDQNVNLTMWSITLWEGLEYFMDAWE